MDSLRNQGYHARRLLGSEPARGWSALRIPGGLSLLRIVCMGMIYRYYADLGARRYRDCSDVMHPSPVTEYSTLW